MGVAGGEEWGDEKGDVTKKNSEGRTDLEKAKCFL